MLFSSDAGASGDGRGQFHRLDGAANVSPAAAPARSALAELDSPLYAQGVHAGGVCRLENVRCSPRKFRRIVGDLCVLSLLDSCILV